MQLQQRQRTVFNTPRRGPTLVMVNVRLPDCTEKSGSGIELTAQWHIAFDIAFHSRGCQRHQTAREANPIDKSQSRYVNKIYDVK